MPTRHIIVIFIAAVVSIFCYHRAARNRYASTLADAMGLIDDNYVEPVAHRELFEGAMRGMTDELDLYSGYVDNAEYAQLQETIDQEFGGVGMVVDSDPESERPIIVSLTKGGPAERAGIQPYDIIYEIDGVDTEGYQNGDAVDRIRGKPGTEVQLDVKRFGETTRRTLTVTRAIIPVQSVRGYRLDANGDWDFRVPHEPGLGYFWIETFAENSTIELADAIESMGNSLEAIIIDLRGNTGGLLDTAVAMCDLFLDSGEIVSVKGREATMLRRFDANPTQVVPADLPMVVMLDPYSASASEIFAACLQDQRRATIVGERSWGKGTVQHVIELEGGRSALRLTTATYWRPSGRNIHRLRKATEADEWGVAPRENNLVALDDDQRVEAAAAQRRRFRAPHPTLNADPIPVDPQLARAVQVARESVGEPVTATGSEAL